MCHLRKLYYNIFYWSFLMYKKMDIDEMSDNIALFLSVFYTSIFNTMNIYSIVFLVYRMGLTSYTLSHIHLIAVILICGLINYMILVRKNRYEKIIRVYNRLKKQKRIIGIVVWNLYWIISTVFFIIVLPKA